MSLFEKHYDDMSLADKKGMDVLYEDWNESFDEAKASDDTESISRLMHNTESGYCLWKILQYLKETALLEDSDDPCCHWKGYLARINIPLCRRKLETVEKE